MASQFINRELSWLEFNQRVLELAQQKNIPLFERLRYLAITASNLDEFFQIRVGGLNYLRRRGSQHRDPSGLTTNQQLQAIRKRVLRFTDDQYELLQDNLLPDLAEEGINFPSLQSLQDFQIEQLAAYFHSSIAPLLTPLAIDPDSPIPHIPTLQTTVLCRLTAEKKESSEETHRFVLLPIPDLLNRFIPIETVDDIQSYAWIEDLVAHFSGTLFPEENITAVGVFRITRNSDITLHDDLATDLAGEMEEILIARQSSHTVRVQIAPKMPREMAKIIQEITNTDSAETYRCKGHLGLADLTDLIGISGFERLRSSDWPGSPSPQLPPNESIFDSIAHQDILLHHPYESFDPIIRLLEEAASDPDVLAIKQVLYRTAKNSRVIDALIRAAQNGKHVTVLVELKARFDEARNIGRAEELHHAGVQIVYGVRGLKTHAKICLIIRREHGSLRRYVHLGTGNYNEVTAKQYTDLSLLTCRPEFGADASLFFNAVTGRSKLLQFQCLVPAPTDMKLRLLSLIASETERARRGQAAQIMMKTNSLQDTEIIEALYEASAAGVKIQLNVRGICCLKPGNMKKQRNISIISIVDRFLEHARIFYFKNGGSPQIFISSADLMSRNLDRRVELMIPIEDPSLRQRIYGILKSYFKDTANAFRILPDGSSKRIITPSGKKPYRTQEKFYRNARRIARATERERALRFEPHMPSEG